MEKKKDNTNSNNPLLNEIRENEFKAVMDADWGVGGGYISTGVITSEDFRAAQRAVQLDKIIKAANFDFENFRNLKNLFERRQHIARNYTEEAGTEFDYINNKLREFLGL